MPWRHIVNLRHLLAHNYHHIYVDLIWPIAIVNVPELVEHLAVEVAATLGFVQLRSTARSNVHAPVEPLEAPHLAIRGFFRWWPHSNRNEFQRTFRNIGGLSMDSSEEQDPGRTSWC